MSKGIPLISSLQRTLTMLEAVIADGGERSVSAIAREAGIPVATAHRQVATLVAEGYLASSGSYQHIAGPRLLSLLHRLDEKQVIANVAAPILHKLASQVRSIVQLGTFENDMVTYRIKTGQGASDMFTKVGMQLEAYCSGIGKVLLAHLPDDHLRSYLANGPFVPLTDRTITDPHRLAEELKAVKDQGFAVDDGEIAEDLYCIAAPIHMADGRVIAAISISRNVAAMDEAREKRVRKLLFETAHEIEQRVQSA
ncbi:IclR family transcriptional regulator [Croceicoccus estronivorus]|uniref:IclR family transcriptional regulator n=1 Tax=Croceicoccus estronivorus TaxID=1172626 RepID=UPI00082CA8B6|nr:IclR family transcriptional regulator [Croceicoccus estronivorus]OCC23448.1 IclR family transcriptional regulator [Croceicoccus estronivorus]